MVIYGYAFALYKPDTCWAMSSVQGQDIDHFYLDIAYIYSN